MSVNAPLASPRTRAFARLLAAAPGAIDAALAAGLASYDRKTALARFHRLTPQVVDAETEEAARLILREIERGLRTERARISHWSYDLNRHIALLIAYRAETARLNRISWRTRGVGAPERFSPQ